MYRIINSPFGNALDAIGQDRTRAQFIGLPVKRYVLVAFVISGLYAGVAGGLFAISNQYVDPAQTLYFLRSGDILFMAILGGFQTLVGPLVGGVVLELLLFLGSDIFGNLDSLVAGLALLVLVFGFPEGVVGSIKEGGVIREGARKLARDPSVVGSWASRSASASVNAAKRSMENIRLLLFGVK
jgi:branched-chain amino acid transport system permease protein